MSVTIEFTKKPSEQALKNLENAMQEQNYRIIRKNDPSGSFSKSEPIFFNNGLINNKNYGINSNNQQNFDDN